MVDYPRSCIYYLECGRVGSSKVLARGTGWIAVPGRGVICTCAHTLADGPFSAGWVRVWVGGRWRRAGAARRATDWCLHPQWKDGRQPSADLAVVHVGELSAFGGFGYHDVAAVDQQIELTGFAGVGLAYRRQLAGRVTRVEADLVRHDLDTKRGMSGAPLWTQEGVGAPNVVGVHARRGGRAVRMTLEHIRWIASFQ